MDRLPRSGAFRWPQLIPVEALASLAPWFDGEKPGTRLDAGTIQEMTAVAPVLRRVQAILGRRARAVRAIAFDKNAETNWSLGWHQDRTIEVQARFDLPGFGPWTVKQGRQHVTPPFALLEKMVTARLHIDPVDAENAPLLIAPGSHLFGCIAEHAVEDIVSACGARFCLAEPGDVWLYATPILHASARAIRPRRRRVLQIDFSADELPPGLHWAAVTDCADYTVSLEPSTTRP